MTTIHKNYYRLLVDKKSPNSMIRLEKVLKFTADGRVVSNFVIQALHNITIYGEGQQTRSFCYVDDLVEGLIRLIETPDDVNGPINLGNPVEFTIRQHAELVIELTGSSSKIVCHPLLQDDPKQRCPDISFAKSVLGWQPQV